MLLIMSAGISVTAFAYSEEEVIYIAEQYLTSWMSTDFGQYLEEGVDVTDEAVIEQFTNWQNLKDNMGEIEQVGECQITEADGIISATQTIVATNDTVLFTVTFDKEAIDTIARWQSPVSCPAAQWGAPSHRWAWEPPPDFSPPAALRPRLWRGSSPPPFPQSGPRISTAFPRRRSARGSREHPCL